MSPQYHGFTKQTVFRLNAPQAHQVHLTIRSAKDGERPKTHHLHKGVDGVWTITLELIRGRHLYRFIVDHVPTLDPSSRGTVHDDHHGPCSMCEIGY